MITSAYLDWVRSSSSSIGGLVMPSGADKIPDTVQTFFVDDESSDPEIWGLAAVGLDQSYQFRGCALDIVVDDDGVELVLGSEFDLGLAQSGGQLGRILGSTTAQTPFQL